MMLCSKDRKRLIVIALFIFSLFSLLILQFYKIQICEGEKWTRIAEAQHRHIVVDACQRGIFYANTSIKKGHPESPCPLVVAVPYFHLYVNPSAISNECKDEIVFKLNETLQLKPEEKGSLKDQFYKKSKNRKLRMWVGAPERDKILDWWLPYAKQHKIERNALYFVQDYKRSYPFGKMLGQVLHTVREDGSIPTGGLEMVFHSFLTGKPGKRMMTRSPRHSLEIGKVISYPENGADIHLTINHYLQAIAEEEIAKGVKKANAKGGWAIMMHPKTGEIYALAQYPFFEPARYKEYFNRHLFSCQSRTIKKRRKAPLFHS
jgi:cell division protein FtsI (penicillin-binding protein 3)